MGAEENIRFVREGFDAYERRDIEAVLKVLDPEVEIYTDATLVNAGTYRGHDGFIAWIERWNDAWEEFRMTLERVEAVGPNHVVAAVEQVGIGVGSGVEVTGQVGYMWEVHDGLATRIHIYPKPAQAIEVARALAETGD